VKLKVTSFTETKDRLNLFIRILSEIIFTIMFTDVTYNTQRQNDSIWVRLVGSTDLYKPTLTSSETR